MICDLCPVGHSSGNGQGGFCPFIQAHHRTGDALYAEGDPVHHVWFIKSGTVVLSRRRGDSRAERVRTVRFAGGFVGIESLVNPTYIDTARASGDTVLCKATCEGFEQWLGPRSSPARTALEASVEAMVRDLPPRAAADGSAAQRVAEWLTMESPQTLTLPRRVVADLLGMRPETLSRALASLADTGAIAVSRTKLEIIDEMTLREIARTGTPPTRVTAAPARDLAPVSSDVSSAPPPERSPAEPPEKTMSRSLHSSRPSRAPSDMSADAN
ncbi:MAG: hypothetical protein Tsb0020_34160 [Haliangiales bacterium]